MPTRSWMLIALAACLGCFTPTGPESGRRDAGVPRDAGVVVEPDAAESEPDAAVPDAGVWDPVQWCLAMIQAISERYAECYGGLAETWRLDFDATCAYVASAQAAGTLAPRSDLADACLELLQDSTCDEFRVLQADCIRRVLSGSVAEGGDCSSSSDCAFGNSCESRCSGGRTCLAATWLDPCVDDGDCPGRVCTAAGYCAEAPVGHTCSATMRCNLISFCNQSGVCEHLKTSGECGGTSGAECDFLYYCAQPDPNQPGTCQLRGAVGDSCVAGKKTCQWMVSCSAPSPGAAGTCQPLPVLGERCDQGERTRCAEGWCDTSLAIPTCVPHRQPGEPCATDSECDSGEFCDSASNTCALYCIP